MLCVGYCGGFWDTGCMCAVIIIIIVVVVVVVVVVVITISDSRFSIIFVERKAGGEAAECE